VDLQDTTGITPYPFVSEWEAYAPKSASKLHQGAELEAQLKARQTYEQATGDATWRHGAAFWELRGRKG